MNNPGCVNLAEHFGRRYRIGWEADGATKSQWAAEERPWLMEIRCRYGVIHPLGGEILCGVVTDHSGVARRLTLLPCIRQTRGDGVELRVHFHVEDAPAVFAVMRPYRRRQVSEGERARLRAIGVAALAEHRRRDNVERAQTGVKTHAREAAHSDLPTEPVASILGAGGAQEC